MVKNGIWRKSEESLSFSKLNANYTPWWTMVI